MLWLKAWLETRWKMVWMVFMGVLLFGLPLETLGSARTHHPQQFLFVLLRLSVLLCFIAAIMLAGSGIQTASPRPAASEKGGEGSTLFTLSLPVTRTRLFAVRTVTGVLELVALLTLFGFVIWLLVPKLATNAQVALGYFAVIVSSSLAVYAISACLSTFCDEGWRFRGSGLVVVVLFMLATAGKLPRSINIFRGIGVTSPLVAQQIPWVTIVTPCILALLFFGAALMIIQRRDY
jgi:hypothetical protein